MEFKYPSVRRADRTILFIPVKDLIESQCMYFSPDNRIITVDHVSELINKFKIEYCQPITVVRAGDGFIVVDGQHRYLAIKSIYDDPTHLEHKNLSRWEVVLDILENKSFNDLLIAFNNRKEFTPDQIQSTKAMDVINILNQYLKIDGPLISNGRCPHLGIDKFISMLQQSKYFACPQITAQHVAYKIMEINNFLLRYMDPLKMVVWRTRKAMAGALPNASTLQLMYNNKVALSINQEMKWRVLLDLDSNQWDKI